MLPDWIKDNIDSKCPYCGSDMEEIYNEYLKCTNRRCSNFMQCPGHNAQKGAIMFKLFGVDGIGVSTCLEWLKQNNYNTHIYLVKYVPENNRKQKLSTILRALCLDGIDSEWTKACEEFGVYRLEDIERLPKHLLEVVAAAVVPIKYMLQYLEIDDSDRPEDLAKDFQYIMITGYVEGFPTKEDFIKFLNNKYGKYIRTLHQTTAKKYGIAALIKEPGTNTMTKYSAAKSAHIPIYTSKNFVKYMEEKYVNKNEEAANSIEHE